MVIIWTNYDGQESPMLHTKFRGNWPAGSGKENFEMFLRYMGMAAILVMWPASYQFIFISMYPKAYRQNLVKNGPEVSEKSML